MSTTPCCTSFAYALSRKIGGMRLTVKIMLLYIFVPPIVMLVPLLGTPWVAVTSAILASLAYAYSIFSCWGYTYPCLGIPTYFVSIPLVFSLPYPLVLLSLSFVFAAVKIGLCMSVCLHRYMAHKAFKCHWSMNLVFRLISTLCNEGGPIWWASQHKAHHKFCDDKGDPHSAQLDGILHAFEFFFYVPAVNEEILPDHCDNAAMRILDTFALVPPLVELWLSYHFLGLPGLFVSYTSGWMAQSVPLMFNIINHPPNQKMDKKCQAANDHINIDMPNVFFDVLVRLSFLFAPLVGEADHEHHHTFALLARRPGLDLPYHLFVRPLAFVGLIWDVKALPSGSLLMN